MTVPEDLTFRESNLCSLGPRPQIITGLFLTLLRRHFADADNIEHRVFRDRLYTQGTMLDDTADDSTGILIEDATVWTPSRTGKRPSIIVKRNAWQQEKRFSFDSQATATEEGHPQYVKVWRGSHTLFCISKSGAETEILTAEAYRFLMHFSPIFRHYFNLLLFEVLEVGGLGQLDEATKRYVVPLTIGYGWSDSWTLIQHVPTIRDIRLSQIFETYYGDDSFIEYEE